VKGHASLAFRLRGQPRCSPSYLISYGRPSFSLSFSLSLAISDEATRLAELLLTQGAVSEGSEEDALHIGIAAAQGADYLLTWNFKHINNAEMKSAITKVVESCGLACPQICSPEELGGTSNN
jgi:hypothetical protein